jgi:hypothetical protein
VTGGIIPGDLVAAVDGKSAVFTATKTGTAVIKATSGSLPTILSGTITVLPGVARKVRVETGADGSGLLAPAESLTVGMTRTVYAIVRDSLNNFLFNVAATTWELQNVTGGVVAGDLVPSGDSKSAVFTAHATGSASIVANSGGLAVVGSGTITIGLVQSVEAGSAPRTYGLAQNYPNPFNPTTVISYQLSAVSDVKLVVYDIVGREVATLVSERKPAGEYTVRFNGAGLASGTYIYRLTAGNFVQTKKLLLLR